MSSVIESAANAAHNIFASLVASAEVKAGDAVPSVEVRINDLEDKINFSTLPGKNILVLVPGAFSPTCSSQVPGYIEKYDELKAKGVKDIYIVSVNDMFVMNAWKAKIASDAGKEGKDVGVKFGMFSRESDLDSLRLLRKYA
jgi:peroxiredoxin